MAKDQKETAAAPKKDKKPAKKSALRLEVERVSKATGLPASFINKKLSAEKKRIDADRKAALDSLATRVSEVVQASVAAASAAAAPASDAAAAPAVLDGAVASTT